MFLANKLNKGGSLSTPDAQFNYVTMLLHGDGTNGAQNNTFLDGSTNNFTITRNGNTTQGSFSPYGSNWSNNLNGSSSFSLSNNTALDMGTGDFTLEFWVFSTDASIDSQYRRFVVTGTNSTSAIQVGHIGATSGVVAYTADDATLTITGTTNVLNTWAHIAVVRQSGTVKLYVNGTSEGTPITDSNSKTTSNFNIGRYPGLSGYLKGNISNIRLVKGTAVYTSNFTPSTTPLTAISGTSLLTCQSNRFIDNSANAFTLTTNGTPSVQRFNPFGASTAYSTSVIGGSGYFDGTGDWLETTTSVTAFGSGNWTVEFFVYPTVSGATQIISDTRTSSQGLYPLFYINTANKLGFYLNTADRLVSTNAININTWTHVAFVKNSTTTTCYLNGVANGTYSDSNTYLTNITTFGASGLTADSHSFRYTGYLSNYRIVVGTAVYTTTFTPPTAPLSAITNTALLLSTTNGAIYDNAMMNNLETVGNAQISTSVKKYGTGSLAFDGTGDYLLGASNPNMSFGSGDFTVEAWVYRQASPGTSQAIFQKGRTADSNLEFSMILSGSNFLSCFYTTDGSTVAQPFSSTTAVALNTWTHIALTRSGSTWRCFVNGTLEATTTAAVTLYTGTGLISSGANPIGDNPFTGCVDELRITKGYCRYTATFTPPTAAFSNTGPI